MKAPGRRECVRRLEADGVVAIVRTADPSTVRPIVEAIAAGGVRAIEITFTVPDAVGLIRTLSKELPDDILLGAGTVLEPEAALQAIDAGAHFIVSPVFNPEVVRAAHRRDVAAVPGCLTPTEILAAWEAGADAVKLFPAGAVGPQYLRDLRGPMPQVRLLPTGGLTVKNVAEWIRAGAMAVGMGTALLDPKAIAEGRLDVLTARARSMMEAVRVARQGA